MSDESGRIALSNAILDFQDAAQRLFLKTGDLRQFQITGPAIPCGSGADDVMPYIVLAPGGRECVHDRVLQVGEIGAP